MINWRALLNLFSISTQKRFQQEHNSWVESALQAEVKRKSFWSESIAIGSEDFVERVQLGLRAKGRSIVSEKEGIVLKEVLAAYNTLFDGKKSTLKPDNGYFIDLNLNNSR